MFLAMETESIAFTSLGCNCQFFKPFEKGMNLTYLSPCLTASDSDILFPLHNLVNINLTSLKLFFPYKINPFLCSESVVWFNESSHQENFVASMFFSNFCYWSAVVNITWDNDPFKGIPVSLFWCSCVDWRPTH